MNPILDELRSMLPEPAKTAIDLLQEFSPVLIPIAQGIKNGSLSLEEVADLAKKSMTLASDATMKQELGA